MAAGGRFRRRGSRFEALVAAAAAAAFLAPAGALASHSRIEPINVGPDGQTASGVYAGVSEDGRKAWFVTGDQLVPEDHDGLCPRGRDYEGNPLPPAACVDLYERDLATGTTILVSKGGNGNFDAFFAGSSSDGSHVYFMTAEPLVPEDTDSGCQEDPSDPFRPCIDIYEVSGGVTRLISTGPRPAQTFDAGRLRVVSTDGSRAFFFTDEPLTFTDADRLQDVYMRTGNETRLLTEGTERFPAGLVGVSDDDRIAILVGRDNLTPEDTDSCAPSLLPGPCSDAYALNLETGALDLVTTGPHGNQNFYGDQTWAMTGNGSRVYFTTAEPLVAADTEANCPFHDGLGEVGCVDLYERNIETGTTTLLSTGPHKTGPGGTNTTDDAEYDFSTRDGSHVYFSTKEPLTFDDTDTEKDLYEWTPDGGTRLASIGPSGGNGPFPATYQGASEQGDLFFTTQERLTVSDTDNAYDVYRRRGDELEHISAGLGEPGDDVFGVFRFFFPILRNSLGGRYHAGSAVDGRFFMQTSRFYARGSIYERFNGETAPMLSGVPSDFSVDFLDMTLDGRHVIVRSQTDGKILEASLNEPPRCDAVHADPTSLLPPNHKLRAVRLDGATDPDRDPVRLAVTAVNQDEPVGGEPDARLGPSPNQLSLRAERDPGDDGRVYRVAFTATDDVGASCSGKLSVTVPRQKHVPATDSGGGYDSLHP